MTFRNVLQKIESRADIPAREQSYRRFLEAAAQLDCNPDPDTVILVAGTNGKGSVAKFLETLYIANGERTALYTSPHLIKTTERIRINNKDLTENEFIEAFGKIEMLHDRYQLSHFETLTLMMMTTFFNQPLPPTKAIIEVGVGGRWDPTRVIPHATTVITKLGLDHQAILGHTIQEIADHKFGAIAPGNLVVHAPFPNGVMRPTLPDTKWVEATPLSYRIDTMGDEPRWLLQGTPLKLQGYRAIENASIAVQVLEARGETVSIQSLSEANWPGRMEPFVVDGKRVYLSGDHNLQGLESLAEILTCYRYRNLTFVFAAGKNKDSRALRQAIAVYWPDAEVISTKTPFRPTDEMVDYDDPNDALDDALETSTSQDLIVVTGSLYLVGYLRARLAK